MTGRTARRSSPPSAGKPGILLVEDDALSREQLADLLRPHARFLAVAENGEQGIRLYREKKPDIVITDILMPVMDGLEMARRIMSMSSETHIIVITAYSDVDALAGSRRLPVHVVSKPVDMDELLQVIYRCGGMSCQIRQS